MKKHINQSIFCSFNNCVLHRDWINFIDACQFPNSCPLPSEYMLKILIQKVLFKDTQQRYCNYHSGKPLHLELSKADSTMVSGKQPASSISG